MGRQDGRKDDARMMTEMAYTSKRSQTVLHEGIYNGYKFYILSLGTHPVAYVECKLKKCCSYNDERLDDVCVHGGFTYYGEVMWATLDNKKFLGWDYAHYGDYVGYEQLLPSQYRNGGKKWTTEEIYEEVKYAIEGLEMVRKTSKIKETSQTLSVIAIVLFAISLGSTIVLACVDGFSLWRILTLLYNCVGLVGMTWHHLKGRRK